MIEFTLCLEKNDEFYQLTYSDNLDYMTVECGGDTLSVTKDDLFDLVDKWYKGFFTSK